MLIGVGVDLLHLARLRALCQRRGHDRLAHRILATDELALFRQQRRRADQDRFLALRWAAKEAAYKALYPHCVPVWKDLVVEKQDASPKPVLKWALDVRPHLQPLTDQLALHLSISHENDHLVAMVVAEDRQRT